MIKKIKVIVSAIALITVIHNTQAMQNPRLIEICRIMGLNPQQAQHAASLFQEILANATPRHFNPTQLNLDGLTSEERSKARWEAYITHHNAPSSAIGTNLQATEQVIRIVLDSSRNAAIVTIRQFIDYLEESAFASNTKTLELVDYLRQAICNNAEVRQRINTAESRAITLATELLRLPIYQGALQPGRELTENLIGNLARVTYTFLVEHNID